MRKIILLKIILFSQLSIAQYLSGNQFNYDVANDNIIEVYFKGFSICEIDLENFKIVNDFYWFENGTIYEIDQNYEEIIGNYSKNEITVYEETFKLEKPIFSKMKLKKRNDKNFQVKIACSGNQIIVEESEHQISDVLKLWLVMKGAERLIQREKNTNIFLNSIQVSGY
nr:hypothetical protein [uncultured Flavobacterium sp.]